MEKKEKKRLFFAVISVNFVKFNIIDWIFWSIFVKRIDVVV